MRLGFFKGVAFWAVFVAGVFVFPVGVLRGCGGGVGRLSGKLRRISWYLSSNCLSFFRFRRCGRSFRSSLAHRILALEIGSKFSLLIGRTGLSVHLLRRNPFFLFPSCRTLPFQEELVHKHTFHSYPRPSEKKQKEGHRTVFVYQR